MRVLTMLISAFALFASVASAAPMPPAARQSVPRHSILSSASTSSSEGFGGRTYVIYGPDSPDSSFNLVITFHGEGTPLTVASEDGTPSQEWIINDEGDSQLETVSLSPVTAPHLQVSWDGTGPLTVTRHPYVWKFQQTGEASTIQDGGSGLYWGIKSATDGAKVTMGEGKHDGMQIWSPIFQDPDNPD